MPKVECFVASWSGTKKFLAECVESLENQSLKPDAIITDESERRAMHKWNEWIEGTDADYLAFPHADDIYLPGWLEECVSYLETHPACAAVFTLDYIINERGQRIGATPLNVVKEQEEYGFKDIFRSSLAKGNVLRCETVVLRVSTLREHGIRYKDTCGTANDTVFWFDVLNIANIGIIPKPLVLYRQHPDSDTQKNVVGAGRNDGWNALEYAASLRPEVVPWIWPILQGKQEANRKENEERVRLTGILKDPEKCKGATLVVAHEPPDNAGTGVLAAQRVREINNAGGVAVYIFATEKEAPRDILFHHGVPCFGLSPDKQAATFQKLVDHFQPSLIEYHHLLRWDDAIVDVKTDASKSLYLHDWYFTGCGRFHGTKPDMTVCERPTVDSCPGCVETPTKDWIALVQKRGEQVKRFHDVYANSCNLAEVATGILGCEVEVAEPSVPSLPGPVYRKRVGFFGGVQEVKGFDLLVECARRMPDVLFVVNTHFFEHEQWMLDGRKLYGLPNVFCLGRYERLELPQLASLVDVCIVPSRFETFGLVVRELKSLGVPVIATKVGGMATIGTTEPTADALEAALRGVL